MKNDYIRKLQVNHTQAEEYCMRARKMFEDQKKHTQEEAGLYCKAAECYRQNVKLSVGEDQKHYQEKMSQCVAKAQRIIELLKQESKPSGRPAVPDSAVAKPQGAAKGPSRQGAYNKDSIKVDGWFRESPKHSFADVSGMEDLKGRLRNCVSDAKYAGLKQYLKIKNLNSFFFYGPPGCGKTFIVEAFVHELIEQGYKYICLEAKDILSKYVGEAEGIVARMFELAEESAPCLVFIDEIDGVCKSRNLPKIAEYEASLTTAFLTGYNHINNSDKEIVFIGATNFPERVDSAMHSRVELIRVPLPDYEARKGYFEHVLKESGFKSTVSLDKMAAVTDEYDYRDMSRLVEMAKSGLFNMATERYQDSDRAIEALKTGEIFLDDALFDKIYDIYIPFPKKADKERLDKWESERGGKPSERSKIEKDDKGKNDNKGKGDQKGKGKFGKGIRFTDFKIAEHAVEGGIFDWQDGGYGEDGRRNIHNPIPEKDIEKAFQSALEKYETDSPTYQESAWRYQEVLRKELDSLMGKEQTGETEKKIQDVRQTLAKLEKQNLPHSEYKGLWGSGFSESYDGFQTVWQGDAVAGFGGTCGIVASCNMINQQTGSRMREEDGIAEFILYGLCYVDPRFAKNHYEFPEGLTESEMWEIYGSNGGTSYVTRGVFMRLHGLNFEAVRDRSFKRRKKFMKRKSTPPEVTLELMEQRMRSGESVELSIKLQDLVGPGLSSRTVTSKDPRPFHTNHATTVAGFSYDENGKVIGVWINETGGATRSTRVFISAEKFTLMRENTRGFSAEFVRK